jgi:TolB-like protein
MAELRVDLESLRAQVTASVTGGVTLAEKKVLGIPRMAVLGMIIAVAVLAGVLGWQPLKELFLGPPTDDRIDSIAVLPFENLSGDPNQEFFVDGITDAVITDLSKIGALKVISRTSIMQYKGADKPLPEIAGELKVQAVLEGTVMRSGGKVRVSAQLIDAATDRSLWAESYDRTLEDVLTLQSAVASAVAREIEIELTPDEELRISKSTAMDAEAYQLYLRGRHYLNQWGPEHRERALQMFKQAVEVDPTSARAYAGLADGYWAAVGIFMKPLEAYPRAKAAAVKAVELDENLADAHVSLGLVTMFADWDWVTAENEFKKAIGLDASNVEAHQWYGALLVFTGRFDEATEILRKARALDPLSSDVLLFAAWPHYFGRDYEVAMAESSRLITLEKDFGSGYVLLGWTHLAKGEIEEGIAQLEEAFRLNPFHDFKAYLAHAYALAGRDQDARRLVEELQNDPDSRNVEPTLYVPVYAALGEKETALDWLETAFEERTIELLWFNEDPRFDLLRSEPRFQEIVRRVGFPE